MDLDLRGDVALATASSSGLGKACATALAREGADVAICARNAPALESARADANAAGPGDVLSVQADVTDPDDVEALVDEVVADFGGIDHLVASAGVPPVEAFAETNERDWYTTFDLLAMSLVRLAWTIEPHLARGDGGSLTAVAGADARDPVANHVLSGAIYRAVVGFVETLALEWAPDVRVNAVLPGSHDTPGLDERLRDEVERERFDSVEAAREARRAELPLERLGDPAAFGDLVAVLASGRAGFVTGSTLTVDGGQVLR